MLHLEEMPQRVKAFFEKVEPTWKNVSVEKYEVMTGGYSRLLARADVAHDGIVSTFVLRGDPPADKSLLYTSRVQEHELLRIVGDAGVRTLSCADLFRIMAFAQLTVKARSIIPH